ncbi:MAG: hypothetical protein HC887_04930 [Desulfobacteraceae bacterium]|nr:hypothetical protein [Desulfobacteraceae bacterium]
MIIRYYVKVNADTAVGTVIANQGVVRGVGYPGSHPHDFPDHPGADDETTIIVGHEPDTDPDDDDDMPIPDDDTPDSDKPDIGVYKVIRDVNGGMVERLDILEYSIIIINRGKTEIGNLVFYDNPAGFNVFSPADSYYVRLIPNTVSNTHGHVITGNSPEDQTVKVDVGNLNPDEIVEIHFQVTVSESASDGAAILNQGTVTVDGVFAKFTDDPYTQTKDDPTQVTVIHVNNGLGIRGTKTVSGTKPNLRWEIHWYNDNNDAVSVHIEDPLATGMSYLSGTADFGLFRYDEINRKIVWDGYIPAGKELSMGFETTVAQGVTHLENQAYLWWDKNNNGNWQDDENNRISTGIAVWNDTAQPDGEKCKLSLGDYVWIRNQLQCDDNGSVKPGWGSSRDSVITDTGINGVKVNLYRDTDHNNKYSPGKDEFIASVMTKNRPDRQARILSV